MSTQKRIHLNKKKLLILLSTLAVLLAAGVVIWLLTPPQKQTLKLEEHQEEAPPPADDSWMDEVRPLAENPPDLTYEEVQSQIDILRAQLQAGDEEVLVIPPPRNYQMKAPPPSADELQPGATTEVEPLVYEKPLVSLTKKPDDPLYYDFAPFDTLVMYYMELHGMVEYHNLEKISVEEALQAEYLYQMWEYDGTMRAYIQLGRPVEYYRVMDYEPMTVIGVTQGLAIWANFAIQDGKLQRFILA